MVRGIAYRRDLRNRKIKRKKSICQHVLGCAWYEHDGQYSKGKIHCSCYLCKYGKNLGLPSLKDVKDTALANSKLKDYYNS